MEKISTKIEGVFEFQPRVFKDDRGWFLETYSDKVFNELLPGVKFVQDNQSFSKANVLRGLHFQKNPFAQGKLVRVVTGSVIDVAVDLRNDSDTYGEWVAVKLTAEKQNMLYIPEGFAHGFYTLEESVFSYKCTNFYDKNSEGGVIWNDQYLGIDWGIPEGLTPNVSEKDIELPSFYELEQYF